MLHSVFAVVASLMFVANWANAGRQSINSFQLDGTSVTLNLTQDDAASNVSATMTSSAPLSGLFRLRSQPFMGEDCSLIMTPFDLCVSDGDCDVVLNVSDATMAQASLDGITLHGYRAVIGRTMVITTLGNATPQACFSLATDGDTRALAQTAVIDSPQVQGQVVLQPISTDGSNETMVQVALRNATTSLGHNYHVHEFVVPVDGNCTATGGHFNPNSVNATTGSGYKQLCGPGENQSACEVGDLSGKGGQVDLTQPAQTHMYIDVNLPLAGDPAVSAAARSIVVHAANGTGPRIGCGNLSAVPIPVSTTPSPATTTPASAANTTIATVNTTSTTMPNSSVTSATTNSSASTQPSNTTTTPASSTSNNASTTSSTSSSTPDPITPSPPAPAPAPPTTRMSSTTPSSTGSTPFGRAAHRLSSSEGSGLLATMMTHNVIVARNVIFVACCWLTNTWSSFVAVEHCITLLLAQARTFSSTWLGLCAKRRNH
eukprot:TRINITY_DN8796_c0_g1_i5.p1 TRINITY_DN8796_c0_g1~~TRINITY_DN8796_c0_g1_i5.p1  ORF type:complete len:488 (+),score=95.95 TRINITY_DN8796_c0_g1_i5:122-1585(+)